MEKLNGTLWKAIQVTLHSRSLKSSDWESVLPDALHSIRSLLCTATNQTPHERMFNFSRKSTSGKGIPSWLKEGPVFIKNHTRRSKNEPPVITATLLHANPEYVHVRLPSGTKTTVSIRDIAQHPSTMEDFAEPPVTETEVSPPVEESDNPSSSIDRSNELLTESPSNELQTESTHHAADTVINQSLEETMSTPLPRRPARASNLPPRYNDFVMS